MAAESLLQDMIRDLLTRVRRLEKQVLDASSVKEKTDAPTELDMAEDRSKETPALERVTPLHEQQSSDNRVASVDGAGYTSTAFEVAQHFGTTQEIVNRRRRNNEIPYREVNFHGRSEYRYNIPELEEGFSDVLTPKKRGPKARRVYSGAFNNPTTRDGFSRPSTRQDFSSSKTAAGFKLPEPQVFVGEDAYTTLEVQDITGRDNGTIRSWIHKGEVDAERVEMPYRPGSNKMRAVYKIPKEEVIRLLGLERQA